jgi:hypothetical protein
MSDSSGSPQARLDPADSSRGRLRKGRRTRFLESAYGLSSAFKGPSPAVMPTRQPPDFKRFIHCFLKGVYYGYMLFTNGSLNAIVAHPSVSLQLSPTVSLTGDTFAFWRTSTNDGLYSQSGAFLGTGQTGVPRI